MQKRVVAARKAEAIEDVLLLCEHPHVITQGRNGKREHLLASEHVLRQKGMEYYETSRGGDITYHGPGQIVGYPILNLGAIRRDVVWYVRTLEEAMIQATAEFGIKAERVAGKTGIWVRVGKYLLTCCQTHSAPSATTPTRLQLSAPQRCPSVRNRFPNTLAQASVAPQAESVSPSSGSGETQVFAFVFSDGNGAQDLAAAHRTFRAIRAPDALADPPPIA